MSKTKIICFEGGEMVGKTTIISKLKEELSKSYKVYVTREPGGCELAEDIRRVLLDKKHTDTMDVYIESYLFAAARRAHLTNKIIPLLKSEEYDFIIFDRYVMSSLTYQGYMSAVELFGENADITNKEFYSLAHKEIERVFHVNAMAIEVDNKIMLPDMTFILDMDVEKALSRARDDSDRNRLDAKPISWHQRIREGYLQSNNFIQDHYLPHVKTHVVNADCDPDILLNRVMDKLKPIMK